MKLTNRQIEVAYQALHGYNAAVSLKVKLRLSRNLRRLQAAVEEKDKRRALLAMDVVTDKTKVMGNNLTAEENKKFQPLYDGLLAEEEDVDLHPIELFDSEAGQSPKAPLFSIDISSVDLPGHILQGLIDIVFFDTDEWPGGCAAAGC